MALFTSSKIQTVSPAKRVQGEIQLPGDKSISHRLAVLGAIAEGPTEIHFFSPSADCASTLECLKALGVRVERHSDVVTLQGAGLEGLKQPPTALDAGNSGSTMRMLSGILAGQPFQSTLAGDASLSGRPMQRVIEPLAQMGARIGSKDGGLPPLDIQGGTLHAIRYELPVPSAQVKSAVLFAGLFVEGTTEVVEPSATRDHTEIALEQMGAKIGRHGRTIAVRGRAKLQGRKLYVPGDVSSAAFFIAAALLVENADLVIHHVGLNPTRTALLDLLVPMGARIKVTNAESLHGELLGDLRVESSKMRGGEIPEAAVPSLIDELPMLAVLGTQTEHGISFRGARELRVKESDRIAAVAENLRRTGAEVEEFPDGLRVAGRQKLRGAELDPHGDHRIAMAFAVAGLVAEGETVIRDSACVGISYPDFFKVLASISS
ncbi:MAG: 3-phosphoshikimate 1-carboxyvinyltransferase [Acidobacteria bacterium]|nr:MAG: 3-phosphoshikimate 1-carboxyvinyltransferase [Acidobacteriota bacterium]